MGGEGGLPGWVKKVKGLREKKPKNLIDTDNSVLITRGERGLGEVEQDMGGQMAMEGDLTCWGEHTIQYKMMCYEFVPLKPT